MTEVLAVGVVLALIAAICVAVFHATKQRYLLAVQAQEQRSDGLELENRLLRAEVRRLSSRPPPPPVVDFAPVSSPASLTPFMSHGSIVPPPPAYLFELPKRVLEAPRFNPIEPPPFIMRQVLPPPPPVAPMGRPLESRPSDEDLDWEMPPPSTLRSDKCEVIAKSLRPPPR